MDEQVEQMVRAFRGLAEQNPEHPIVQAMQETVTRLADLPNQFRVYVDETTPPGVIKFVTVRPPQVVTLRVDTDP